MKKPAFLKNVEAPRLLIVRGEDYEVLRLNERTLEEIASPEKVLEIISGATHLLEEQGTLEQAARLAQGWFKQYL